MARPRTTRHPRGVPTWPDWRTAAPGTRVEHVRTGHQGTLVLANPGRAGCNYAVIEWDPAPGTPWGPVRGRVVAPAFDLRVVGPG